ncbi:flavin reductase like domain-containing protein, partial [Mycotypha africana]|uniref:flavin reductase like domain-containing protein n=1 Tax=Mycotypha africana TaxID=64632 RepID=UPI002300B6A3
VTEDVRGIMRRVPQPVAVVTTSRPVDIKSTPTLLRRGVTVGSFTSVCLQPEPLVSFCVRIPSRASDLLHSSGSMVVNLLAREQVQQSIAFSSPTAVDQFIDIPFYDDPITGLPVLVGTLGAMHCDLYKVVPLGDHELWITRVTRVEEGIGGEHGRREEAQPLLYYDRGYRSVGDQVFMNAFAEGDEQTLTTSSSIGTGMSSHHQKEHKWMHRAHLRMAWNYIRELGPVAAAPVIKETLQKRFSQQQNGSMMAAKKGQVYHETITSFYIALMSAAIRSHQREHQKHSLDHHYDTDDFFALVERFPELLDTQLIESYYSSEKLYSEEARHNFIKPDLKPLP